MSVINTNAKEIHCKILYCGPDRSGKKSSLLYIRDQFEEKKRVFFTLPFKKEVCCLILSAGEIFGFQTYFHLYNLNNESKKDNKSLLRGGDGVMFVASSDLKDGPDNVRSFLEMEEALKERGENLFKLPLVLQYNKRDIQNPRPVKDLRIDLNKYNNKDFESSALTGQFILEPLKYLCKLTINNLKRAGL